MVFHATLFLLARVPEPGPYADPIKVGVVVLLLLGWAAGAQWIDRDTDKIKTRREQWNLIVISGGAVASFVLLVVPVWRGGLFLLGVLFWLLLAGGAMLAYLVHRNARVAVNARVLTLGHAKRLITGGRGKKRPKDKGQRVQVVDHAGNFVELPDDPDEALAYQAIQELLFDLLWRRVSEADIVAGKEKYKLVIRIDGVAAERPDGLAVDTGERIVRYLKKIAGLNVEEIRRPQMGLIQASLLNHEGHVGHTEVHTSGTTAGERMRLKIQADSRVLRLNEIGLAPQRLGSLKQIIGKNTGLFLLSAPPQHGLTTTQYALIRSHDAYMNNIHAIERRPLAEVDNITQHRYEGGNTDVNYARMLQTVLRREPNIIMIGECEDRETASIATRAAADDRKIYMGIQAKDTFDALTRYLSLLNDNQLAAKALLGVINQRLIRLLCDDCREAFEPDAATLKKLNLPADKIERFYRPPSEPKTDRRGKEIVCMNCQGSGYVGRTGVYELMMVDSGVAKLIVGGAPIDRIKAQCRKNKMYYLQEELLLKVIDGKTSMNEILRCLRVGQE